MLTQEQKEELARLYELIHRKTAIRSKDFGLFWKYLGRMKIFVDTLMVRRIDSCGSI